MLSWTSERQSGSGVRAAELDFRFDEYEREVIDQARRVFARYLPSSSLLAGDRAEGWRAVGRDGWLHMGLPDRVGGGETPLCLVCGIGREAGRVLGGDAFVNNAVLLPSLMLMSSHNGAAFADLIEHPGFLVANGTTPGFTVAADRVTASTSWCFGAERGMSGYMVEEDGTLLRFEPGGWTLDALAGLGLGVGTVSVDRSSSPSVVAHLPYGSFEDLGMRASIVHSASLVGLAEAELEQTVGYARERKQFGIPIGQFQAVKHGLADVAIAVELAWNAVLYASLVPEAESVSAARILATDAADAASRAMMQFFGGISITWDHQAHLFVKTALADVHRFGTPEEHARRLGAIVIETRGAP
jgi:alkylation response protein AidB-like acyl-CoA dehydrogenase